MKQHMLAYIAPADLLCSWPELASQAGFQVELDSNSAVLAMPGLPDEPPITCRYGIVSRGGVRIQVWPNAGAHPASRSPIAGKWLILIFYERLGPSSGLAHEFGELLIRAGAISIPLPSTRAC
jgi:hypothetical protein